ncbi:glycosyltransferase family 4 protein [Winogradskyella arenosi]|uniref:Glycosyltransferase involved in cell wall biosynthesis n=1 Tax=Winogradskyella arenosi TaxID=533325 RepID=A0A368ZBR5_9FLAO|nr:glycosyltransferase family 4 protein [Winogradskyella arenosi]RCW90249.1 glycosyltransferase involved in cell wall biosynthesis [Winogradskyella arenosi]
MINEKLKLWIFVDWYLPAYKAGGPIQSISNLVNRLKDEFDISIITSNTDLEETLNLKTKDVNVWVYKNGYRVMYLDANHQNQSFFKKILSENSFDVVYFNSLFSVKYTLLPFWLLRNKPIKRVLATRGMLGKGALAIKPLKKILFLKLFRFMGLHKKVVWHATAESEKNEIIEHFGIRRRILLAPNLSSIRTDALIEKKKNANQIHLFYLSRIAIKKNLFGALEALLKIKPEFKVRYSIIGPIEDKMYWEKCLKLIDKMPEHISVNYLGAVPNHKLSELLKTEHVLFLPTYGENFGHVIMESWQNGCPVIISDQTPWLNLELKELGYDVPLEKENGFVKVIEKFCEMSELEYNKWSNRSYIYANEFIENPELIEQNKALFLNENIK